MEVSINDNRKHYACYGSFIDLSIQLLKTILPALVGRCTSLTDRIAWTAGKVIANNEKIPLLAVAPWDKMLDN